MAYKRRWTTRPDYRPFRDDDYLETGLDFFHDCPLARDPELAEAVWQEFGGDIDGISPKWWAWKKWRQPQNKRTEKGNSGGSAGANRKDSRRTGKPRAATRRADGAATFAPD